MQKFTVNITLKNKVIRSLWNVAYIFLFRPFGTKLFRRWRLFLLRLFGAKVHKDSGVYSSAKIWAPWNLELHKNAWIGYHVVCYNMAKVILEEDTTISQYSYLCTASHNVSTIKLTPETTIAAPITVHTNAWVGTQAFIGPGVSIGEGAIVGARAAVFKDVEPWTIVGGNPAKFIKKREIKN
jgi:putative colanic acid biosynthesis acetyltransferase WcaF